MAVFFNLSLFHTFSHESLYVYVRNNNLKENIMKSFNEFSDSKTVKYWDCVIEFKYSDSNFIRKMNRSDVNEPHFLVNTSEKKYNTLEDAERFLYSEMNNLLKN